MNTTHMFVQTMIRLRDFIAESNIGAALGRKLQRSVQLGFDLHGGVSLADTLATPEVSKALREEVLEFKHGTRLQVGRGCMLGLHALQCRAARRRC